MFKRLSICMLLLTLVVLPACGGSSGKSTRVSGATGTTPVASSAPTSAPTPTVPPTPTAVPTATPVPTLSWEQVIQLLTPSTVLIHADIPASAVQDAAVYSGTGIVLNTNGDIVTNAHIVDGAAAVTVYTSGSTKKRPARIVGVSPCDDLAVIKVTDVSGLTPATFGKGSEQQVGEDVAAIGYPESSTASNTISISRGIISKLEQSSGIYQSVIQTDAAVNPGNSGGPLVNAKGQVIGINTFRTVGTTGINYAISGDLVQQVVPDLQAGHNKLYLGMNLGPNNYSNYFGTSQGLVVEAVAADSPASIAGVQQAFLLTQLAGLDVNSMADVCKILLSHQDGDVLKVQFLNITNTESQILAGEVTIGKSTSTAKVTMVSSQPLAGTATTPTTSSSTSTGTAQHFSWDFSSDNGDWPTGTQNELTASVSSGEYSVQVGPQHGYILMPQSIPNGGDQAIKVDVNIQTGYAGVVVRDSTDSSNRHNYYDCFVFDRGTYSCGMEISGQWTAIIDTTSSSAIKIGQTNTLELDVQGSNMTFYVNGALVNTFSDSQLTQGTVGLEAGAGSQGNSGSVTFSNASAAIVPQ